MHLHRLRRMRCFMMELRAEKNGVQSYREILHE